MFSEPTFKQASLMQQALCWFPIRLLWPLESEVCSTLQHHTSPAFNRWRQGGALSALSTAWRSRICRQSVVCKMQIVAACWCSLQIMGRPVSPREREVLRRRTSVTAMSVLDSQSEAETRRVWPMRGQVVWHWPMRGQMVWHWPMSRAVGGSAVS